MNENIGRFCCKAHSTPDRHCFHTPHQTCEVSGDFNGIIQHCILNGQQTAYEAAIKSGGVGLFEEKIDAFLKGKLDLVAEIAKERVKKLPIERSVAFSFYKDGHGPVLFFPEIEEDFLIFYKGIPEYQLESIRSKGLDPQLGAIGGSEETSLSCRGSDSGHQYLSADILMAKSFAHNASQRWNQDKKKPVYISKPVLLKIKIPLSQTLSHHLVHHGPSSRYFYKPVYFSKPVLLKKIDPTSGERMKEDGRTIPYEDWYIAGSSIPPSWISYIKSEELYQLQVSFLFQKLGLNPKDLIDLNRVYQKKDIQSIYEEWDIADTLIPPSSQESSLSLEKKTSFKESWEKGDLDREFSDLLKSSFTVF